PGRMPGPPGHRPGVRRQGHPRGPDHAWQDLADPASGRGRVRRFARWLRGHALPLAGGRQGRAARVPRSDGVDRERGRQHRGGDGPAPSRASGGGRAVPSGVDPDRTRARPAEEFSGKTTMTITPQEALQRTIEHREIFHDEMVDLMRMVMRGEVPPAITAAILTGLRVKKET